MLELIQEWLFDHLRNWQVNVLERLLVVHVVHCPHQVPDVVDGVEDLWNPAVNVHQGVDSFHGRPDRVFSGEDSVPAWRLGKVADES